MCNSRRQAVLTWTSFVWLLAGLMIAGSSAVAADEPPAVAEAPQLVPVVVFNIASAERSLTDIANMFDVAGRPDMMDVINSFLGAKAGDLKGLDRSRSLGYMLFLEPSLPPRPRMVVYLPVTNEADLVGTLRLGPAAITEVGEHEYEIENRGRRGRTPLLFQGDYAFLLPTGEGFLAGETFPDPGKVSAALTSRYDVAFSIRLRGIPQLIREVFSSYITQHFSSQMQQRDNERDSAYEARRAQGTSTMKYLQQLIRDGEEIVIGIDSTQSGRRAVLELSIDAKPESEFAKYLTGIAGQESYFSPLLQTAPPLQMALSWNMDAREQEAALGMLKAFRTGMKEALLTEQTAAVDNPVDQLVNALEATVNQGKIDGVLQFLKCPGDELAMVAGFKVIGAETVGRSLKDLLHLVKELDPESSVQFDVHQFQGVNLHKLPARGNDPKWTQIYGRAPDLFVGTSSSVLWMGFGGNDALPMLDQAIEIVAAAPPAAQRPTSVPFQIVVHASSWLKYVDEEDLDSPQGALIKETLDSSNDALVLEVVPTETGARVALRFDEGFVHLLGSLLAQLYDQTQL